MDLEIETLEEKDRDKPVATYVWERDDGRYWGGWLQTNRVELNAMTTPQFIDWLDDKMAEFGDGKLIPPEDVLEEELDDQIESKVREEITERILREADVERQVADAIAAIETPDGATLAQEIADRFEQVPDSAWRDHIEDVARRRK